MKCKLLLVTMLCMCGCLPASQQEVQTLTGGVTTLLEAVDALQETTEQLAVDGLIDREKVDKINANIDKVQEDVAVVVKEVETAPDAISALEKGWNATKDINPLYVYGTLAIAILKLLQKNKQTNTSLEEVVFGIEDAKKSGDNKTTLKASLNAAESIVTRKKVAKILV